MEINNSYLLNIIFCGFGGAVCFDLVLGLFFLNCPALLLLPVGKERKMDRVAKLLTGRNLRLLRGGGR